MNKKITLILSLLACVSCKRPQSEGSTVSIQIPSASQFAAMSKNSSLTGATVDFNRLCFAVNVKGPDISTLAAESCNIERGEMAGSVATGGTLSLMVSGGTDREFEIYGFLKTAATEPCPSIDRDTGVSKWPMTKVYLLGSLKGVTIVPPEEKKLPIEITLPAETQNLAIANNWPVSCGGVSAPQPSTSVFGKILPGASELTGSTMKMRARLSERNHDAVLNSTNFKFKGGVR